MDAEQWQNTIIPVLTVFLINNGLFLASNFNFRLKWFTVMNSLTRVSDVGSEVSQFFGVSTCDITATAEYQRMVRDMIAEIFDILQKLEKSFESMAALLYFENKKDSFTEYYPLKDLKIIVTVATVDDSWEGCATILS